MYILVIKKIKIIIIKINSVTIANGLLSTFIISHISEPLSLDISPFCLIVLYFIYINF